MTMALTNQDKKDIKEIVNEALVKFFNELIKPSFEIIFKKLDKHDKRFDKVEEKLEEHDGRFDKLDARLDRQGKTLDNHEKRISKVEKVALTA